MNPADIQVRDEVLYRGDWYRVLDVLPGRIDPVTGDPADICGVNQYQDVDYFGFEDIEAVEQSGKVRRLR